MSPKDWFGVAARMLGLWTVIEGLRGFVMVFGYEKGWFPPSSQSNFYLANSLVEFLVGAFLLPGTNLLAKFCYPEDNPQPMDEPPKSFESVTPSSGN